MSKQIYILLLHPESDSLLILKEEEFDKTFDSVYQLDEIDRFDDIDFANYEGRLYADKHNCDFTEYTE